MTKIARKLFLPLVAIMTCIFGALAPVTNVSAVDATATNFEELVAALADSSATKVLLSGDIVLEDDITLNKTVRIDDETILNLNDHTVTINSTLAVWSDLMITGDGEVTSDIENPILVVDGDLTINNGNFSGGSNVYTFFATVDPDPDNGLADIAGNIYINDGYFDISNIIINNYGTGEVIISGGYFLSEGLYVEDIYADSAFMTSVDGTFDIDGDVIIESVYRFLGDKFVDENEDRGEVTCTKGIIYEDLDWDDDWEEIDYHTTTVCGYDNTLEEDVTIDAGESLVLLNTNITVPAGITLSTEDTAIIVGEGSTLTICGEYDGDEDLLIEDGGTIVRECTEAETEEDNPATLDGITAYIIALLGLGTIITIGYFKVKTLRR